MLKNLLRKVGLANPAPVATTGTAKPTPPLQPIIDVTDATFAEVVLAARQLVVVDFWAEWCQPCQIMAAYVSFLAQDFPGQLVLAAMDVDENPLTSPLYEVMGLPTLLFFSNGEVMDRVIGIEPYAQIRQRVAARLAEKVES